MPESKKDNSSLQDLRIVFMGTPEFAVASLRHLYEAGAQIVGVITAPDKPAGRGMKMKESAVKKYAAEKQLKILQPEKLKNPLFLEELRSLKADLQLVVAFRMLPEQVWNMPTEGTVNLHASLLPQYRGAAPINWAIINGEKETGLTTFKLQQEIDTGNILLQEKLTIGDNETAGELHDRMKIAGAKLLLLTAEQIAEGKIVERPQQPPLHSPIRNAPKIFTDTCKIHWDQPVDFVHNLVRGLSPFPGAFTQFEGKMLKIFIAHKEHDTPSEPNTSPVGIFESDHKSTLKFRCDDGWLVCDEVQLEGKRRMETGDFLRGYRS